MPYVKHDNLLAFAAFLSVAGSVATVWADELIIQRGDSLFVADGAGAAPPRKTIELGTAVDVLWAAAPDGRRLIWLTRSGAARADTADAAAPSGLGVRPATVYLSDSGGGHKKKLFATDALRDRQGRLVATLGFGQDEGKFEEWEPASVSWSADSRTVYLSGVSLVPGGGKATFAVDAASGVAVIDARGRWKSITAATSIDARGGMMVGSGVPPAGASDTTPGPFGRPGPLLLIDLANGTRTPVFDPSSPEGTMVDFVSAGSPALAPYGRLIAFSTSGKGLWVVDRKSHAYRLLVAGDVLRPRWATDGKTLYFLLARPGTATPAIYDLYATDTPRDLSRDAPPPPVRLVMQTLNWFDIAPE